MSEITRLHMHGTAEQVAAEIASIIDTDYETAKNILLVAAEVLKNENPDEFFKRVDENGDNNNASLGLLIGDTKYYISVKRLTLQVLALILDNLSFGLASFIASSRDSLKRWLWIISDDDYCVLTEIIMLNKMKKSLTEDDLVKDLANRKECCNILNTWKCPFLYNNYSCNVTTETVKSSIDKLINDGVIDIINGVLKHTF